MYSFNPRSRTGNDIDDLIETAVDELFQSTFPHGERLFLLVSTAPSYIVSIHVPARGTTPVVDQRDLVVIVSIHVPARGTTTTWQKEYSSRTRFQSTFPHGERLRPF